MDWDWVGQMETMGKWITRIAQRDLASAAETGMVMRSATQRHLGPACSMRKQTTGTGLGGGTTNMCNHNEGVEELYWVGKALRGDTSGTLALEGDGATILVGVRGGQTGVIILVSLCVVTTR